MTEVKGVERSHEACIPSALGRRRSLRWLFEIKEMKRSKVRDVDQILTLPNLGFPRIRDYTTDPCMAMVRLPFRPLLYVEQKPRIAVYGKEGRFGNGLA